ncbi:ATP-binding protein [Halomonas halocynthiae]|uniref:ATP-binding protein n=1 Tax=Halomonas halocynthiae TaxID=176290 RepID=UPI000404F3A3|nr:ATP-binding protein [Halomonas halocynthiae]
MVFRRSFSPTISRLGIRLFVIILTVNVAIAGLVFVAVSRSLDKGFIEYLDHTQAQRANALAGQLANEWELRGDWRWLRSSPRTWHHLVRRQLWLDHSYKAPQIDQLSSPRDFVLYDADDRPIIGLPSSRKQQYDELRWIEITHKGQLIGTLGYRPPQQLMARVDRLFLSRQRRNLATIVAALGLASLFLAGGLSWWLGRRTRSMALATRKLTQGDYRIRLAEQGRDELSSLAQDFNVLAATLEANRKARNRWVSDIAHELRTPLAVLRGEIEAMQDGVRPLSRNNLTSLAQEVAQLERLVTDLRLLSQSDDGALEINFAPLDLAASLEARLDEASGWLNDQQIQLESRIEKAPAWIRGDSQRLRQLWTILLDNTCSYTTSPGRLRVSLDACDSGWRLTWEDSAPGVPPSELSRLTERLYRVEGSRNRASGGSGLGLSIAQALARAHGATMQPDASPLGGLRWTLSFPNNNASVNHTFTDTPHGAPPHEPR